MPAISGCIGGQGDSPGATLSATPSAGVAAASLFDRQNFTQYTYWVTTWDMAGMPMYHTYRYSGETYQGQTAIHANITEDMRPDSLVYLDIWSSPSNGSVLGMHVVSYATDQLTQDADVDPANYTKYAGEDPASPAFFSRLLAQAGTDVVTVAGNNTYTAAKYADSEGDTFWVAGGVPVPVKILLYTSGDKKDYITYELADWSR